MPKISIKYFIIMGDSLSDRGTMAARRLPGTGLDKSPNNRFTDGLVWSDYFAELFAQSIYEPAIKVDANESDLRVMHPLAGMLGRTFCEGGATAHQYSNLSSSPTLLSTRCAVTSMPILRERLIKEDNLLHIDSEVKKSTLVIAWLGANDLLTVNARVESRPAESAIQAHIANLEELIKQGYLHFCLFGLPDLSSVPRFEKQAESERAIVKNAASYFNNRLQEKLIDLKRCHPLCSFMFYDVEQRFVEISTDESIQGVNKFWDDVHPSTAIHQALAKNFYLQIKNDFDLKKSSKQLPQIFREYYFELTRKKASTAWKKWQESTLSIDDIFTQAAIKLTPPSSGKNKIFEVMVALKWMHANLQILSKESLILNAYQAKIIPLLLQSEICGLSNVPELKNSILVQGHHLTTLRLNNWTPFTQESLYVLAKYCQNLETLDLSGIKALVELADKMATSSHPGQKIQFPHCTDLNMSNCDGLQRIHCPDEDQFPVLAQLNITGCTQIQGLEINTPTLNKILGLEYCRNLKTRDVLQHYPWFAGLSTAAIDSDLYLVFKLMLDNELAKIDLPNERQLLPSSIIGEVLKYLRTIPENIRLIDQKLPLLQKHRNEDIRQTATEITTQIVGRASPVVRTLEPRVSTSYKPVPSILRDINFATAPVTIIDILLKKLKGAAERKQNNEIIEIVDALGKYGQADPKLVARVLLDLLKAIPEFPTGHPSCRKSSVDLRCRTIKSLGLIGRWHIEELKSILITELWNSCYAQDNPESKIKLDLIGEVLCQSAPYSEDEIKIFVQQLKESCQRWKYDLCRYYVNLDISYHVSIIAKILAHADQRYAELVIPALLKLAMEDISRDICWIAEESLCKFTLAHTDHALSILLEKVKKPLNASEARYSMVALRVCKQQKYTKQIIPVLFEIWNKEPWRHEVVYIPDLLGSIGHCDAEQLIPILLKKLQEQDIDICKRSPCYNDAGVVILCAIVRTLGNIGRDHVIPILLKKLQEQDTDVYRRSPCWKDAGVVILCAIIRTLGNIGQDNERKILPILLPMLKKYRDNKYRDKASCAGDICKTIITTLRLITRVQSAQVIEGLLDGPRLSTSFQDEEIITTLGLIGHNHAERVIKVLFDVILGSYSLLYYYIYTESCRKIFVESLLQFVGQDQICTHLAAIFEPYTSYAQNKSVELKAIELEAIAAFRELENEEVPNRYKLEQAKISAEETLDRNKILSEEGEARGPAPILASRRFRFFRPAPGKTRPSSKPEACVIC